MEQWRSVPGETFTINNVITPLHKDFDLLFVVKTLNILGKIYYYGTRLEFRVALSLFVYFLFKILP